MAPQVTITFLGGLGDIGRNCAAIETEDSLLILDCGQLFSGEDRPGVDAILPDLDYLEQRADKIVGCIATHGHEDHIGALAYLLDRGVAFPIYSSAFTLGLIGHRLEERDLLRGADLVEVKDHDVRSIGPFEVEFLPVTHSVPGGYISAITTPQGIVLHSSDFKLDYHPVDNRRTDLARIGALSNGPGIRLMLADSTNSDVEGSTVSESSIGRTLSDVFSEHRDRRIICASFSSHIHRVQQVADAAVEQGRMVATLGLSMKRNTTLARKLGLLRIPDANLIDISDVDDYPPERVCIISTGSQGEYRSALAQAAEGRSKWIEITETDTIVLSSHPIPGNEEGISNIINALMRVGANVVDSDDAAIHTSGHGKRGELATLHSVACPEWFVPVHGEERHLRAHADLARSLGMPDEKVLLARDGDRIVLEDDGLHVHEQYSSGVHLLVHGPFVEPDGGAVAQRLVLGNDGVVIATVVVDIEARTLLAEPRIVSRGWVDGPNLDRLHCDIAEAVRETIEQALGDNPDPVDLARRVRRATGQFVSDATRRRPMIVPTIIEA